MSRASTAAQVPRAPRRLRTLSTPYLWLAPALALIAFVLAYPAAQVIRYSLTDRTTFTPGTFVGFDNYSSLLDDPVFWKAVRNNLILLLSIPTTIVIALVITAVLYRGIRGGRLYELLIFLPFLPAVASIGVIFIYLLGWQGPLNTTLRSLNLGGAAQAWLTDPNLAIWSVLAVVVWKRIGFTVLLFMARMLSLDRDLFDAAAVDGASWRTTFRRIALPQMRSIIQFAAVLGFIEVFSWTFAYIFVLTRGGPFQNTYTLEYLLYQLQFQSQLVGLASAVAVVLLLVALGVAVYRVNLSRREGVL